MIDYYDSCRYRLLCALTELNGQSKPGHRLSQFLTSMRDKQVMDFHFRLRGQTTGTKWVCLLTPRQKGIQKFEIKMYS